MIPVCLSCKVMWEYIKSTNQVEEYKLFKKAIQDDFLDNCVEKFKGE